ncbi:MAG TPA: HAMP domain-containing sensor histidine kinase [Actinomycetota bacterium]|nr:HAMP domain-containing sensor histidine kinase [Actinomycetota bacterium]
MTRPLILAGAVAAVGAAATLAVGAALGMGGAEILHLALLLLPAALVTVTAAFAARRLLTRVSFAQGLVAIAVVAAVVAMANLWVLSALMFVDPHDATVLAVLLLYSVGAGVAAAVVVARSSSRSVHRLGRVAEELAEGDLGARVGSLEAGPELERLARTLDEMAGRLQAGIERERSLEARRRDLVTAASHDLRTPLAGLRAMVEAIEDGVVQDPATVRRYVGEMRRSVDTMASLVDDLFELTQLDAGAIDAETERARLSDVVRSAVQACRAQALERGLAVEERLDGAGDATCSPRLVRVLQNLLQNAIRHSDGIVIVEAQRRPDGLVIVVEDDGEGIPAGAHDRVFEPFWRGDAARSSPGSGLGLALARRIVEALGGDIRVESSPSTGSRFAVMLPARPS